MKNIDHLPESEKQHYILCDCGSFIDMRNLGDVFSHMHAQLPQPEWSHSKKSGEPALYLKSGGRIDLN